MYKIANTIKRCGRSPHRNILLRCLCSSSPNPPTDDENFRAIVLDFINKSNARHAISEERYAISEERYAISEERYAISEERHAIVLDFINESNARHAVSEKRHSELEIWKSSIDEYKPVWDKAGMTYELANREYLRRHKGEEFVRNLSSDRQV